MDDHEENLRARSSRPIRSIPVFSKYGTCNRRMRDLLMKNEDQERIRTAHTEAINYACAVDDQDPLWLGVLNYCDPRSKGIADVVADDDDIRCSNAMDDEHMCESKCEVDVPSQEWRQNYSANGVCNRRMRDLLKETENQQRVHKAEEEAMRFACSVDEQDPLWGGMLNYCDPRSKGSTDVVVDDIILMGKTVDVEHVGETKSDVDIPPQGYSANGVCNRRMQDVLMARESQERLRKAEEEAMRYACTVDEEDPLWRTMLGYFYPRSTILDNSVDPKEGGDPSAVARSDDDCDDDDPTKSATTLPSEGSMTSWPKFRDFSAYRYEEDNTSIVTNQSSKKTSVGIGAKASSSIEVIYDKDRSEGRRCSIWGKGSTPSIDIEDVHHAYKGQLRAISGKAPTSVTHENMLDEPNEGRRCSIKGKTGARTATATTLSHEVVAEIDEGRRCTIKHKTPLRENANEVAGDDVHEGRRCSVKGYASPIVTNTKAVAVGGVDEDGLCTTEDKTSLPSSLKDVDEDDDEVRCCNVGDKAPPTPTTKEVAADDIDEGRRCTIKAKLRTSAKEIEGGNEKATDDTNEGRHCKIMAKARPTENTKEVAAEASDEGRRCAVKTTTPGDDFDEGRRCTPFGDKARPIATFDKSLRRCETFKKKPERRVAIRQTRYVSPPRKRN